MAAGPKSHLRSRRMQPSGRGCCARLVQPARRRGRCALPSGMARVGHRLSSACGGRPARSRRPQQRGERNRVGGKGGRRTGNREKQPAQRRTDGAGGATVRPVSSSPDQPQRACPRIKGQQQPKMGSKQSDAHAKPERVRSLHAPPDRLEARCLVQSALS
jgi:hypothetical protein